MTTRQGLLKDADAEVEILNPVQWLEKCCPQDLVPRVLAFCGPQTADVLMRTNRYWHGVMSQEQTWRVLCEELYKWREDRDPVPQSWKSYYRLHPCVPTDYSTVQKALAVASNQRPCGRRQPQVHSVHIYLRPGKYHIRNSLLIHPSASTEITVETMELPKNRFFNPILLMNESCRSHSFPKSTPKRKSSFRKLMSCVSHMDQDDVLDGGAYDSDNSDSLLMGLRPFVIPMVPPTFPTRAELVLRTRRHNEPLFRVTQGTLKLRNVDLHHHSAGIDIWNGNAAVQVQPPTGVDDQPIRVSPRPTAELEHVTINSTSGRGIVNIDGGHVVTRKCCVHDCAATGIYVGGPGSEAELEETDVIRNGLGCRNRRGIGRGHSGVYLEQGVARINECNISNNSLTGISAISPQNAILHLEGSELFSNGSYQLELPPTGSESRRQTINNRNRLAMIGTPPLKSGLEIPTPLFDL